MPRHSSFHLADLPAMIEQSGGTPEHAQEAARRIEWLTSKPKLALCREVQVAFACGAHIPKKHCPGYPGLHRSLLTLQRGIAKVLSGEESPDILRRGSPHARVKSDRAALCLLAHTYDIGQGAVSPDRAMDHLDSWCNVADHFGLWQLRYLLEDTAFRHGDAENYDLLCSLIEKKQAAFRPLVIDITAILHHYCHRDGIDAHITTRTKNMYGIFRKMQRKGKNINHINDLFGIRVMTEKPADCYRVLDILHRLWPPFLEEFRDYIRAPKQNGYQSIHTTVACLGGTSVEFQIRTEKMHHIARHGPASHAAYKAMSRKQD